MRRVTVPHTDYINLHEMEFSHFLAGEPIAIVVNPDENWIEVPDGITEEEVLDAVERFTPDPEYAKPEHHKRAIELLDKDTLTQSEENELRKLERQILKEALRGRQ